MPFVAFLGWIFGHRSGEGSKNLLRQVLLTGFAGAVGVFFAESSGGSSVFFLTVKRHIFKETNARVWDREFFTLYLVAK